MRLNVKSKPCPTCLQVIRRCDRIAPNPVRHLGCAPGYVFDRVLREFERDPNATAGAIAGRLDFPPSTVAVTLRSLVAAGLID